MARVPAAERHRGDEPAGERGDPAQRLERARALAWRALNRRERTELELRGILAEKRVAPEEAHVVLGELLEGGFIDDAAFAQRFADDRRRLDAWGAERIARRLRELGVAPDLVAAAVGEQDREDELEAAIALLRRRVPGVPATPRERDRALGHARPQGLRPRARLRRAAPLRRRRRAARLTSGGEQSAARGRMRRQLTHRCARVIAPDAPWYYDPASDRPALPGLLKLQQTSHFQRQPAASAVTANPTTTPGCQHPVRRTPST